MPAPRLHLLTQADDAGSAVSANDAMVAAADAGLLRNVGLMVPGPAFADAAARLGGRHDLCLGLHVTLNSEWSAAKWGPVLPAAQVPSLVDERGYFTAAPQVLHARGFSEDEALAEVAAQLATARAHGLTITYLDTHMGVSWLGNLRARLAEFAAREGLVNAVTIPHLPALRPAAPDPVSDLLGRLQVAAPGTYIYLNHPADDSAETRRWDAGVASWRAAESRLWRSPRVRQAFTELGVAPCSYASLPGVATTVPLVIP